MTQHYGAEKHETKLEHEEKAEGPPQTKEEKAAVKEEERIAKEAEEVRGKERVRDKVARLLREIRGGAVFGGARKALWEEVEALVGRLKGEETVGEMEKERAAEEAKAAKKSGV